MSNEGNTISPPVKPTGTPTILQVLPALETGGVERGAIDMAIAIKAAGWTPLVASEGGRMVRELERLDIEHIPLPLASKKPWRIKANTSLLADLVQNRGVSLIHARSRAPAHSARQAALKTGVPFVTTFHGTYNLGPFGIKRRYNGVMASGDRVIAISNFIRAHILDTYPGTDPDRLRVIHRGIDMDHFDPARVSAERMIALSERWRLRDGEPVILLPGRLTRWKGQLLLLEALARLIWSSPDAPPSFRCIIAGDDQGRTAYRAEVEAKVERLGLTDRVLVVGACHDIPAAMMISDVVVSASTDPEAFGRVVAEAQALGRPVVAPRHGGAPEILRDGETGWLFSPCNPDSLADALRKALSLGEVERAILAQKAYTHARAHFSKTAMCAKTLDVYRELLGLS